MNAALTRTFYILCVSLLVLPLLIFLFGWVRLEIGLPLALMCVTVLVQWFRTFDFQEIPFVENRKTLLLAFGFTFCWVFASGIGGYAYQNYDFYNRNAVLRDLTLRQWPVVCEEMTLETVDGKEIKPTLTYYFGFMLFPALCGKGVLLLGASPQTAMNMAYFLCFFQSLLAVFAAYVMISRWLGRFALWPLIFFIGFSGWDVIPYLLFHRPAVETPEMATVTGKFLECFGLRHAPHLEWFTHPWLNSSMTGQLFWLFNYSVPFFLAMAFFLTLSDWRGALLVYAALFLSAPIPAFGLFPLMVWLLLKNVRFQPIPLLRLLITPANLLSLGIVALIAIFYHGNASCGETGFFLPNSAKLWALFGVYFLTEFLVWLPCVGKNWNVELGICLAVVLITSFVKLGGGSDFAMRTAMPCFFCLMLCVLRNWYAKTTHRRTRILILLVFAVGLLNPLMEFKRCAGNTLLTYAGMVTHSNRVKFSATNPNDEPDFYIRDERITSIFELKNQNDPFFGNFTGRNDSFFFKYLKRVTNQD